MPLCSPFLDPELSGRRPASVFYQLLEITAKLFGATIAVLLLKEPGTNAAGKAKLGFKAEDDLSIEIGTRDSPEASPPAASPTLSWIRRMTLVSPVSPCVSLPPRWGMPAERQIGEIIACWWLASPTLRMAAHRAEMMRAIADRSALAIRPAPHDRFLAGREVRIADFPDTARVQEDERKRISRELHDETVRRSMVIRLYLGMLESTAAGRGSRRRRTRSARPSKSRGPTIEGIRAHRTPLAAGPERAGNWVAAIRKEAKDLARNTGIRRPRDGGGRT